MHLLPVLAALCYLAASLIYPYAFHSQDDKSLTAGRVVLTIGFLTHCLFLALFLGGLLPLAGMTGGAFRVFHFSVTLSLLGLVLCAAFLLFERRRNLSLLGIFLAPLVCFFMLLSALLFHLDAPASSLLEQRVPLLVFHIMSSIAGNIALSCAFIFSAAYIVREKLLKRKAQGMARLSLPPLETLDRFQSFALSSSVVLLAAGLVSGMLFAVSSGLPAIGTDPRFVWSLGLFVFYSMVLALRFGKGIRGVRGAWLSLVGFGILLLSFLGTRFFGDSFHVY